MRSSKSGLGRPNLRCVTRGLAVRVRVRSPLVCDTDSFYNLFPGVRPGSLLRNAVDGGPIGRERICSKRLLFLCNDDNEIDGKRARDVKYYAVRFLTAHLIDPHRATSRPDNPDP